MIIRGTCEFGVKALNAQKAGAISSVIYNSAAGGDALINMGAGAVGDQVTIPAIAIGHTNGTAIGDWYTANGAAAQVALRHHGLPGRQHAGHHRQLQQPRPGRGQRAEAGHRGAGRQHPGPGLRPTAPARPGTWASARPRAPAWPRRTWPARPRCIRQIHPIWSNAWIKSALMSTSKYMDIYTDAGQDDPAQPLDMGAGRLDLTNAADPGVILDPPSLSFGQVMTGTVGTIKVKVTSVAAAAETYAMSTLYTGKGFGTLTTVAGMTVTPASLTLAPGETKTITVTWDTAASMGYGDNQGFVVLTGSSHKAHMPAWMRVGYAAPTGNVLIIDNDGSTSLGLPDYTPYYTARWALGVTYDVWDADAHAGGPTIPDATCWRSTR